MLRGLLGHSRTGKTTSGPKRYESREIGFGPLLATDMPIVWRIERATYPTPWPVSLFQDLIEDPKHTVVGAKVGKKLLGYFVYEERENVGHVSNFCVGPEHRRRGLGSLMMAHLLARLQDEGFEEAELEVRESNVEAQRFYEQFGFSVQGAVQQFYFDTMEDAFLMRRDLTADGQGPQEQR